MIAGLELVDGVELRVAEPKDAAQAGRSRSSSGCRPRVLLDEVADVARRRGCDPPPLPTLERSLVLGTQREIFGINTMSVVDDEERKSDCGGDDQAGERCHRPF